MRDTQRTGDLASHATGASSMHTGTDPAYSVQDADLMSIHVGARPVVPTVSTDSQVQRSGASSVSSPACEDTELDV